MTSKADQGIQEDKPGDMALVKAVLAFDRADTELRRATAAGAQPRQQKAGNRLFTARYRMVALAKGMVDGKR